MVGWITGVALAGQGMWPPDLLPQVKDQLEADGIQIPAAVLADPKQLPLAAIVSLGGCSASFVSADGLVITNAHCATRMLSSSSTKEHDRVEEGWTAKSREDELPGGPTAKLWIVESITDVTADLKGVVNDPKIADAARVAAVDQRKSELVAKCEKAKGRRCTVVDLYAGQQWKLIQRLELRDLRVVWVPPADVAFFGGDADNFEWPRHDGDVAILRAYVAPNGAPAEYSKGNVAYHPPKWLRIDQDGVSAGDAVMAIGYPGRTRRDGLPEALQFVHEVDFPTTLASFADIETLLAEEMAKDPAAASKLRAASRGIANARKRVQGIQDNLDRSTVLADRIGEGRRLDAALAADPSATAELAALTELRKLFAEDTAAYALNRTVDGLLRTPLLSQAHAAYRWSIEREVRKDTQREPGYQDRDRADVLARTRDLDARLWLPYERRYAERELKLYAALPADQHLPALDAWLTAHGGVDGALKALFDGTPALAAVDARVALFDQKKAALEASTNPWVQLAVTLERGYLADRRAKQKARDGARLRYDPVFVAALQKLRGGGAMAPDANGTLRVTFGKVTGFTPRDGLVATPQTRLQGLVAKSRLPGYHAPEALLTAATRVHDAPTAADRTRMDADLGDVPMDFLADLDTTGGSSGSATLNAEGELVGLAFDGNYEALGSDYQYDPQTTRSLHVDVRCVLWLLEQDPAGAWIDAELLGPVASASP